jgi:MFS superfamily sulfate permease-like transporter
MLQPQNPIVVDVVKQPPITPEISYGSVLLSAIGVVGVLFVAGIVVGIIVGCVIIWRKKQREATEPVDHSHVKLHISG